ncbi:MAG: 4Fe-4S binding protein [Deltaproteobacteria bacterium]
METARKIIEIDEELCDGCGNCIVACAEGALELIDGKATLVSDVYCDGLGACLGECPTGALKIIEREAPEFDEEAVEERLASLKLGEKQTAEAPLPHGCPSARIQTIDRPTPCQTANEPVTYASAESALSHWPVQIRLIPPTAPFLKNADLLVTADCTPVAYAGFHRDFLDGKVVMVGCPKFDDTQSYLEKFTEIFKTADIHSITTVFMEVPCCHGLPTIVKRAMELAGKNIPMENIIIGVRGEILKREKLVA